MRGGDEVADANSGPSGLVPGVIRYADGTVTADRAFLEAGPA